MPLLIDLSSLFQMKLLPVSAVLVTCLLTGLTRRRASPISHQKVSQTSGTLHFCQHVDSTALWWCVSAGCARSSFVCPTYPGYAFLLFQDESSVQALIDACIQEDGKLYLCVSSPTIKDKPVSGLFGLAATCLLSVLPSKYKTNTSVRNHRLAQAAFVLVCLVTVCQKTGKFSTASFVLSVQIRALSW